MQNLVKNFNISETYVNEDGALTGILAASAAFTIGSTKHCLNDSIPVQLVFGRDMILPIEHNVDW